MKRAFLPLFVITLTCLSATTLEARSLQKGMSGADVRTLQEDLARIPGIFTATPTGYFGSVTETAVRAFQEREGIVTSGSPETTGYGLVGPRTLATIRERAAAGAASGPSASPSPSLPPPAPVPATSTAAAPAPTPPPPPAPTPVVDTTPPLRSGSAPGGTLPFETSKVTIAVATNEPARCYWSPTLNTPYEYMRGEFGVTGGTIHSSTLSYLRPGDYTYYVRCRDNRLNANTTDYPILFSIEHRYLAATYPPRVAMGYPTGEEVLREGFTTLSAIAADNAEVAHVRFFLDERDLGVTDTQSPYAVTVFLSPGAYTLVAVATDGAGNHATSSPVAFTVSPKLARAEVPAAPRALASVSTAFFAALQSLWDALMNNEPVAKQEGGVHN